MQFDPATRRFYIDQDTAEVLKGREREFAALRAALTLAENGCACRVEERDAARAQAEAFKRRLIEAEDQRAEMHRRLVQAECDRERTYQENRILTQLWCGLRDKVRALPKSDMTIGCWHDLQDFVKNQSHTFGRESNAKISGPAQEASDD
jgi:hypothetical protein